MITFRPIGRLGNNLFQAAACIGYAKAHGTSWAIPQRRGAGDTFEGKPTPWLMPQFWPNLPTCYGGGGHRYEQHEVKDFNYAPIPYFGSDDVTLVGFFQSEKWFENAKEEVKKAFPLKYYPEYEGYVSIHVRRGDYVTNSNSFPPVNESYISDALQKLAFTTRKILFFSDDISWCKQLVAKGVFDGSNDSFIKPSWFDSVEFNEDQNEYTALSKMASCSHHIIANSTFSWWSAWLGHNPDRIVVSPSSKKWFGPGFTGGEPVDLIPPNWIQI